MSDENAETIERFADAWSRQDADAFLATVDPDVEWEDAMFYSEPMRVYRGHREVREWFERALIEPWESFRLEVEEIIPAGDDRVVAGGFVRGRGRGSGVETGDPRLDDLLDQGRADHPAARIPGPGRGIRSRGTLGVGDVAGESR